MRALDKERKFFEDNRSEWERAYPGKFVLVKDEILIGVFDSDSTAVTEGIQRFGLEPFLVRNVAEKEEAIRIPALMFGLLYADYTLPG